jgi:two-component system, NarL family, response regulator NreC
MNLRLALIDDHQVFRDAFKTLLEGLPGLSVVAEASEARAAYPILDSAKPDVAVVDVSLPGLDGISATRELTQRYPGFRVMMLTAYSGEDYVIRALSAGAGGYALKAQPAAEIIEGIRSVARGERYLAPAVSAMVIPKLNSGKKTLSSGQNPLDGLTAREREIFNLVVRGFSNVGMAEELCISIKTVETHRANINRKLRVHSSAQLVRFAALRGLVSDS